MHPGRKSPISTFPGATPAPHLSHSGGVGMRRVGRNQGRNFVATRRLSFLLIQTKLPSTPLLSRRRFSCDPLNVNTRQSSLRQNVSRRPGSDCRRLFQQPPSQLFSVGSRCTAVPTGDHLSSYMQTRRHHVRPTTKAMRVEGDPRIRQVNAYNRRPAFLRALPLAFVVRDRMVRTMLGAIITLVFLAVSGVGAFGAGPSSPSGNLGHPQHIPAVGAPSRWLKRSPCTSRTRAIEKLVSWS